MNTPNNYYGRQLQLLVQIMPAVMAEPCFALKGGTAINLFYRDLPRYSVDIDLTYLPAHDYRRAQREMDAALRRIAGALSNGPVSFKIAFGRGKAQAPVDTITVSGNGAQVKIEVNPTLRSTVFPIAELEAKPNVQREFGFVGARVLSFEDVYAGKMVAALDRQHPRDLFDVKLLLEQEGITDSLFKTFLVYVVGHKGVISHVIDPRDKDLAELYEKQFVDMAVEPVSMDALLEARRHLVREIHARLDAPVKKFLVSAQRGAPDWTLLGLNGVDQLPAIKWKLLNVKRMSPELFVEELATLEGILEKIGT